MASRKKKRSTGKHSKSRANAPPVQRAPPVDRLQLVLRSSTEVLFGFDLLFMVLNMKEDEAVEIGTQRGNGPRDQKVFVPWPSKQLDAEIGTLNEVIEILEDHALRVGFHDEFNGVANPHGVRIGSRVFPSAHSAFQSLVMDLKMCDMFGGGDKLRSDLGGWDMEALRVDVLQERGRLLLHLAEAERQDLHPSPRTSGTRLTESKSSRKKRLTRLQWSVLEALPDSSSPPLRQMKAIDGRISDLREQEKMRVKDEVVPQPSTRYHILNRLAELGLKDPNLLKRTELGDLWVMRFQKGQLPPE